MEGVDANNPFTYDPDGALAAVHVGYDRLLHKVFLLGGEFQGGLMGINGHRQYPPYVGVRAGEDSRASTQDGVFASLVGRLGFVGWNRVLFYGRGGWAWTDITSTFIDPVTTGTTLTNTTSPTRNGSVVGGGLEYAFHHNWSARVEYNYYDFGTVTSSGTNPSGTVFNFRHKLTANSVALGVSRKF